MAARLSERVARKEGGRPTSPARGAPLSPLSSYRGRQQLGADPLNSNNNSNTAGACPRLTLPSCVPVSKSRPLHQGQFEVDLDRSGRYQLLGRYWPLREV